MRQHPPTITAPYILDQKEPVNVSPDHPGTQALASAFQQVVHNEPALTCTTATSDGNYLFANGQTVVTFGPGSPDAGVHGTNETINLDNLITATKIYALAAINYCGFNSIQ
jgi:acetylornithine deacetylase